MKVIENFLHGNNRKTFEVFSIKQMMHENHLELFFLMYRYGKWEWMLAKYYEPLEQ